MQRKAGTMTRKDSEHARVTDQLCFALHAPSRAVVGAYTERLATLGLTYTQYLTLLAIWENDGSTVKELGQALDLDSGTLSPVLKKLHSEGLIRKERSPDDERLVFVFVTEAGKELEGKTGKVRAEVEALTGLDDEEFSQLRTMLHTLRERLTAT